MTFEHNSVGGEHEEATPSHLFLFYDHSCVICSTLVRFLIRIDSSKQLRFISLRSPSGNELNRLVAKKISVAHLDTLIVLEGSTVYIYSSAVLHVLRSMGYPWSIFGVFSYLPTLLRNFCYRVFAKYRKRFQGECVYCLVPEDGEESYLFPDKVSIPDRFTIVK